MKTWLYWVAAAASLGAALLHELSGFPMVLSPLAGTQLPPDVIWLLHFSWHGGTLLMIAMAFLYYYAARYPGHRVMAGVATALYGGIGLLAIGLAVWGDPVLWTTPAPYLWPAVTLVGGLGMWQDTRRG